LAPAITAIVYDDEQIRFLKHIQNISNKLSVTKFTRLTEDQQDFLNRTGRYAPHFPVRDSSDDSVEETEEW